MEAASNKDPQERETTAATSNDANQSDHTVAPDVLNHL